AGLFNVVSLSEAFLRIAEGVVIVLLNVVRLVFVNEIAFGFHRLFGIEVAGQKLVLDINQLKRFLGGGFIFGDNAGNVVTYVTNFVYGECVLIVPNRQNAVSIRSIRA